MEHFGVWKGRDVYTITHAEYVKHEYYKPDTSAAFWITGDNYFVADNKIVGKVIKNVITGKVEVDDTVKIAGSKYYYAEWAEKRNYTEALKEKLCEEIGVNKEDLFSSTAEAQFSADKILASVYTSKLWED